MSVQQISQSRLTRRGFLQAGALGMGGLALPDLLKLNAQAGQSGTNHKSVIMICLNGGPSHIDMYDMKPESPADIRGEYQPISTNVSGMQICEKLPLQAKLADKFSVVRSLVMKEPSHQLHECYTGYQTVMGRPSFGSVVSAVRGQAATGLPRYVSLSITDHPRTVAKSEKPTWMGQAHAPFEPSPDTLHNLARHEDISHIRLQDRTSLLREFDRLKKHTETSEMMQGQDAFTQQALDILTSSRVRDAFDISHEPQHIRDLYGDDEKSNFNYQFGHTWRGTSFLQARRLVEAGVPVVTLAPGAWDHHGNLNGVRGTIFQRLGERLPHLDRSLSALITDLHQRGMQNDVLVVMWGEFGRTPRVNKYGGRDHWPRASFVLFSGGGYRMGQMIGETDSQASAVTSPPYNAQNVFMMIYRHLGIDATQTFPNFAGRPMYVLDDRAPIKELL